MVLGDQSLVLSWRTDSDGKPKQELGFKEPRTVYVYRHSRPECPSGRRSDDLVSVAARIRALHSGIIAAGPPCERTQRPLDAHFDAALTASAAGADRLSMAVRTAPGGTPLDNGGATFPPSQGKAFREIEGNAPKGASRWRLKAKIRTMLKPADGGRGPSVCGCGAPGFQSEAVSLVRRKTGAGAVGGVMRCDSPWLCPTCAPARALKRRDRLTQAIEAIHDMDGEGAFVTLTIRHDHSLRLADAKRIVSEASRRARQGRRWLDIKDAGGILGVIQGVEVLHSIRTGWHFHAHLFIPGTAPAAALLASAGAFVARYIEEVRRLGATAEMAGQDVQLVAHDPERIADYASKGSAAWEVAGGAKEARSAVSRTPWDLVTLAAMGDEDAARLFAEYAEVMPGTRSCVVSASLAKALDIVEADDADEPGEEQDLSEIGTEIGTLTADLWRTVWGRGRGWMIVKAIEADFPMERIQTLANRLGAEAATPPPPPLRIERSEIDRIVSVALGRAGRAADRARRLDETIADHLRHERRWGRPIELRDEDRHAIEMAFLRKAARAPALG